MEQKILAWEEALRDLPGEKPVVLKPEEAADPAAAGLAMRARAGEEGEAKALRGMARQMALLPPPALMEFLKSATDSEIVRAALFNDAAVYSFSRNAATGLALLASLPAEANPAAVAKSLLHFFPPKDLPAVAAWYAKLPAGELKTAALTEMVPVLKRQDFPRAAALVAAMPQADADSTRQRRDLLRTLFVDGFATGRPGDTAAEEARLAAAPAEDRNFLRQEFQFAAYELLAKTSREQAVTALADLPAESRSDKAVELFSNWARTDPTRAVKGLADLPEDLKTPQLYSAFAKQWTEGNVGAASQWVKDLPAGPQQEAAVTGLAAGLAQDYPAEAFTWAATLTDPADRREALQNVINRTPPESLSAAVEALRALDLPPEEKAAIQLPAPP